MDESVPRAMGNIHNVVQRYMQASYRSEAKKGVIGDQDFLFGGSKTDGEKKA